MDISIMDAILVSLLGMGIVFVVLVVIMVCILVIGRAMKAPERQKADQEPEKIMDQPSPAPVAAAAVAPEPEPARVISDGRVHLNTVSDRTAAMLMAIVAEDMGKPLDELQFLSVKEIGPAEGV